MANVGLLLPRPATLTESGISNRHQRPFRPLRTESTFHPFGPVLSTGLQEARHSRHKSTTTSTIRMPTDVHASPRTSAELTSDAVDDGHADEVGSSGSTSPSSPLTSTSASSQEAQPVPDVLPFDFSKIDYELERAQLLGEGLWSTVFLAHAKYTTRDDASIGLPTPSISPQPNVSALCGVFAVKMPSRSDARNVFLQEARILTHLMQTPNATQYVVAFCGQDPRNSGLVSEAVLGGSLESLNGRMQQMTEVARHVELVSLFPQLADDLVSGLAFLHAADVVHADIKPGNVLLDICESNFPPRQILRARYIDFSASFRMQSDDSTSNAGGTWDYLSPEQLRREKDLSTPTFASDVWSLGITLLSLMVGVSPYTAACGDSVFRVREAVKGGDPIGFARYSPKTQKRMAAAQDFVDCCRLALQKDRERRVTAAAWKSWLVNHEMVRNGSQSQ